MRQGEAVFVDSGAWIALALLRDPLHSQAREQWDLLSGAGAKLHTSVPVVIETFTFLDRNTNPDAYGPFTSRRKTMSRRSFLKASGVAMALPFLDAMVKPFGRMAQAAGGAGPAATALNPTLGST